MEQLIPFADRAHTERNLPRFDGAWAALGLSLAAIAVVVAALVVEEYRGPTNVVKLLRALTFALMLADGILAVANIRRAPAAVALGLNVFSFALVVKLLL